MIALRCSSTRGSSEAPRSARRRRAHGALAFRHGHWRRPVRQAPTRATSALYLAPRNKYGSRCHASAFLPRRRGSGGRGHKWSSIRIPPADRPPRRCPPTAAPGRRAYSGARCTAASHHPSSPGQPPRLCQAPVASRRRGRSGRRQTAVSLVILRPVPLSSNSRAASTWPCSSKRRPPSFVARAALSSNSSAASTWPFWQATYSGDAPSSFVYPINVRWSLGTFRRHAFRGGGSQRVHTRQRADGRVVSSSTRRVHAPPTP